MAVNQSQLAHTKRQITVGTWFGRVYKDTARAVHRFDREIFFIDHCCVHIFFNNDSASGCLPEMSAQHDRSPAISTYPAFVMDLSPIIEKCIFQYHTFREEERKSGLSSRIINSPSSFPSLLWSRFFASSKHCEGIHPILLFSEMRFRKYAQHFVLLASAPICACNTCQFKCFYRFCCHQMRSAQRSVNSPCE